MRKEFAKLRKENNVNWFVRNIKLINWIIFAIFAILFFAAIIAIIVMLVNKIPEIANKVNELVGKTSSSTSTFSLLLEPGTEPPVELPPESTTPDPGVDKNLATINDACIYLNSNISIYYDLMSLFKLFFVGVIGMFVSRIIANGCLIFRNVVDYKKIHISKSFFVYRMVMLSIICVLVVIVLATFSASLYNFIFNDMQPVTDELITMSSDFSKKYVGFYNDYNNGLASQNELNNILTQFQTSVESWSNKLTNMFDINNNCAKIWVMIKTAIVSLSFLVIWAIFDIVYGAVTLRLIKKALN